MPDWPEDFAAEWRGALRAERAFWALRRAFALRRQKLRAARWLMLYAGDALFLAALAAEDARRALVGLEEQLRRLRIAAQAEQLSVWRPFR